MQNIYQHEDDPKLKKQIEDGGPAFPYVEPPTTCSVNLGMSLRDWFAGQALTGLIALASDPDSEILSLGICQDAYRLADSMLEARKQ